MRVFVAGATGVAGRGVVPALVSAGYEVTAAVRSPAKSRQARGWGARAVEVDLFDPVAVRRAVNDHEAVCNFATHIPAMFREALPGAWSENDRVRRHVSANLVAAALESDCPRFLQESIGFVYPDRSEEWINEQIEPAATVVTKSALDAEANVARFTAAGRTGVTLRFAQFYGPGSVHSAGIVHVAERFGLGPLVGDPDGFSSWIHQDNLGPAVVAALSAPAGIYNVGDDEPVRRRELHDLFAEALGRKHLREIGKLAGRMGGGKSEAIARSQRLSNAAFASASRWVPGIRSAREGWPALIGMTHVQAHS
jgi:nucleoside-diphosphate-sugar epimerase